MMINVLATIQLKSGTRKNFLDVFNANVPSVLAEEGCIEYYPTVDVETDLDAQTSDENMVIVIEKWESLDALQAHLKAPHMIEFRNNAGEMIEAVSLKIMTKA